MPFTSDDQFVTHTPSQNSLQCDFMKKKGKKRPLFTNYACSLKVLCVLFAKYWECADKRACVDIAIGIIHKTTLNYISYS